MAPASVLNCTEPSPPQTIQQQQQQNKQQNQKNLKFSRGVNQKIHNSAQQVKQSTIELSDKETDSAYKKICKFLRRLKPKKSCKLLYFIKISRVFSIGT